MDENSKGKQDDTVYKQLARRLGTIPNGFPATESGVELKMLAKLFTLEEAALALQLKLTPESAEHIAQRTGDDPQEIEAILDGMALRGLIRAKHGKGRVAYGLTLFVVGIYELQLPHMDEEFARLFEDYYREAFHELLGVKPPLQRVIPVEQNVPADIEIMPYERASELLGEAQSWGVMDCICRKQKKLIGQGCEHPLDVCMIFSRRPGTFDESEVIRALTKEEALGVLHRAEEAGLVHTVGNTQQGVFYVCNCCTCSCAILRGVAEYGLTSAVAPSAFRSSVDEDLCTGCELCLDRCQFGALSVVDSVCQVDERRCFGCGLCITACGDDALSLAPRAADQVKPPPESMPDWMMERAAVRQIDLGELEEVIGKLISRKSA